MNLIEVVFREWFFKTDTDEKEKQKKLLPIQRNEEKREK
jgi:hypothetical protein